MKKYVIGAPFYLLLFSLIFIISCKGQEETTLQEESLIESATVVEETSPQENDSTPTLVGPWSISDLAAEPDPTLKINTYVNRIFQDSRGTLWFGTVIMGIARYDGKSLEYFSPQKGFGGDAVRGMAEDGAGNVWFATSGGISKYSPAAGAASFTNYTEADGLTDNDVWSIAIDKNDRIWIGTLQGLCYYDGKAFIPFDLPEAAPDTSREVTSGRIVHCIMEDSKGNMWFGTNGGAYIYDPSVRTGGTALTHISENDGLCNNAVNRILEDKNGDFWFATYHNGVCRRSGTSFTHIPTKEGFKGSKNAWDLYEDTSGNIWFPIDGVGMYRYDGNTATEIFQRQSCVSHTIQCTIEDNQGHLWFGGWLGVYRYDG